MLYCCSLTYANNSQDPSGATIVWTFSDGNISGQGSGGARTTTGTTVDRDYRP